MLDLVYRIHPTNKGNQMRALSATESPALVNGELTVPVRLVIREADSHVEQFNIYSFRDLMEAFTYEANCWLTRDNRETAKMILDQLYSMCYSTFETDRDYFIMVLHGTRYEMRRIDSKETEMQYNTYSTGTKISEIERFDRSTKVRFQCPNHPDYVFMSKEPSVSHWFPGDDFTSEASFRNSNLVCDCDRSEFVTVEQYQVPKV